MSINKNFYNITNNNNQIQIMVRGFLIGVLVGLEAGKRVSRQACWQVDVWADRLAEVCRDRTFILVHVELSPDIHPTHQLNMKYEIESVKQ